MNPIRFEGNKRLWWIVAALMIISLLAVYSTIGNLAWISKEGNTTFFLIKHGGILLSGSGIIYLVHKKLDIIRFSRLAQIILIISIILLLLTFCFGLNVNSAKRVLPLFFGLTFQPSDIAKVGLVMYLARILASGKEYVHNFNLSKGGFHILLPIIVVCALILPFNLSTAAMVYVIAIVMLYIGKANARYIGSLIGIAGLGLVLILAFGKLSPHTFSRLTTWENRIENYISGEDSGDGNYQALQSKIAIANGWPLGTGFGNSTQRHFLPQSYNDFIFSTIVEQTGILGAIAMILLYMGFYSQCYRIARNTESTFGKHLVLGIGFMIIFQALLNMMVATGLLPVTGQPLPLVSMGGTSIWITCFAVGVVLQVSRTTERAGVKNNK